MQLKLRHPSSYKTTRWSAGTTTELYILPEGADYASRQFDLRISSATVEAEESTFTPLPGFQRILTPLEEPLEILHPDRQTQVLVQPYDLHAFSGGEETKSRGRGRDFNVIYRPDLAVQVSVAKPGGNQVLLAPGALCLFFSAQAQRVDFSLKAEVVSLDLPDLGLAQLEALDQAGTLTVQPSQVPLLVIQISR
ncbi:MAG: HutD family protein [Eubacteriales bacterium]|nr:HutD family protein [Clostridiales bacterium]MDY5836676.1 HutD family protein [Eubacteriales bacterium]